MIGIPEALFLNIRPVPNGCWEWAGTHTSQGYAELQAFGSTHRVHRLMLQLSLNRALADGENACHHCDNPGCVRPAHLYAGTQADNMRDMAARGRARKGGRAQGLPLDVVVAIRQSADPIGALAARHGVSVRTIARVLRPDYRPVVA